MLAKQFRFHGHGSVLKAYKQGKSVRNELGSLNIALDNKTTSPRVAVVVSKKVNKSAVARNRIRRRAYELIRLHPDHAKFQGGMVFTIYQPEAETMPKEDLTRSIYDLIDKSGLLAEKH